jgi:hypothetical protein
MGLKTGLAVFCVFVYALASFVYKVLDHYVHLSSKFRATPLGQRLLPSVERKVTACTEAVASWGVRRKLADLQRWFEKVAVCSLLAYAAGVILLGSLNLVEYEFVQKLLLAVFAVFLLASVGRACFEWTLRHRGALREFVKALAAATALCLAFMGVLAYLSIPARPQRGGSFWGDYTSLMMTMTVLMAVAGLVLYAAAWVLLGAPVAIGGAAVWAASKTAGLLVRNCNENTLIYAATLGRLIAWATPVFTVVLYLILRLLGFDGGTLL